MREQLSEKKDEEIARLIQSGKIGFFDILGERQDSTVRAFGIRRIEDEFRSFERRLRQLPIKRNR